MALKLGQEAISTQGEISYTMEAAEALSAGDAVAINGGQLAKADGTTDTNVLGVVGGDASGAGDEVQVYLQGVVVANVASGATAGTELGTSATEGQLASGSGGFQALSDEGGSFGGNSLAANEAVVKLP